MIVFSFSPADMASWRIDFFYGSNFRGVTIYRSLLSVMMPTRPLMVYSLFVHGFRLTRLVKNRFSAIITKNLPSFGYPRVLRVFWLDQIIVVFKFHYSSLNLFQICWNEYINPETKDPTKRPTNPPIRSKGASKRIRNIASITGAGTIWSLHNGFNINEPPYLSKYCP